MGNEVLYFNDEGGLKSIDVGYELCYNENGPNYSGNTSYSVEEFNSIEEMAEVYTTKKLKEVLGVA